MRKLIYLSLAAMMLCATGAAADAPLLPDHFGDWQAAGPAKIHAGVNLYSEFGSNVRTEALREAGLRSIEERTYKSGDQELRLTLEVFKDSSGAYQAYTQEIAPDGISSRLGDESWFGQNSGKILLGNLVVGLGPYQNLKAENLAGLDAALRLKADRTPFPPLKTYMPSNELVFGSQRYAQGPEAFRAAMVSLGQEAYADLAKEVGFESGVEAMLGRFRAGHDGGVLVLLEYPTPQIAEQHLHHLEQALTAEGKKAGSNVERKASLLSMVFESKSAEYAQALRNRVNYETQVTWNESSHTATDAPIVVIMVKIFLFTGMFLGIATGLGVAFGGARVVIKRLFPGKVFDRPQDIEVLQLGLSGKKIDPSDMY